MREFSEQELVRREKLKNIKNPYPERFEVNTEIAEAKNLEDGTTGIRVAGRIVFSPVCVVKTSPKTPIKSPKS